MKSEGKCTKIRKMLPYHAMDALGHRTRASVDEHIRSCADCRAELDALKKVATLVETSELEAPPDMWPSIFARLKTRMEPGQYRGISAWLRTHRMQSMVATGAVIITLVGVLLNIQLQKEQPQLTYHTYLATHAAISWTEPFADKAALGLISTLELQKEADVKP